MQMPTFAGCIQNEDRLSARCLSYDFCREQGEEEPLGGECSPLISGEELIGTMLAI